MFVDEVNALRHDEAYLEVLHLAVAMDIDGAEDQLSALAGSALSAEAATAADMTSSAAAAAKPAALRSQDMPGVGLSAGSAAGLVRLLLVLDTNVLLTVEGLRHMERMRALCGPGTVRGAASGLQVEVVLPWIVLVELDRLKSPGARAGLHDLGNEHAALSSMTAQMARRLVYCWANTDPL